MKRLAVRRVPREYIYRHHIRALATRHASPPLFKIESCLSLLREPPKRTLREREDGTSESLNSPDLYVSPNCAGSMNHRRCCCSFSLFLWRTHRTGHAHATALSLLFGVHSPSICLSLRSRDAKRQARFVGARDRVPRKLGYGRMPALYTRSNGVRFNWRVHVWAVRRRRCSNFESEALVRRCCCGDYGLLLILSFFDFSHVVPM